MNELRKVLKGNDTIVAGSKGIPDIKGSGSADGFYITLGDFEN